MIRPVATSTLDMAKRCVHFERLISRRANDAKAVRPGPRFLGVSERPFFF